VTTSSMKQIGWPYSITSELFVVSLLGIEFGSALRDTFVTTRRVSAVAQSGSSGGVRASAGRQINQGNGIELALRWEDPDRGSWPPAAPWRH